MEKKQMLQIYLIYHINLCKMYASTKFSNILKSEKAKNDDSKHKAFLFSEYNCFISTETRYKPFFNVQSGINRSNKTL